MKDIVDQWKIILFGSTIVFMYQLYTDLKTYRNQHHQKPIKKGVKICLTGGPCGGKTEGIAQVSKLFGKRGIPTFIVPQAATILGAGGGLLNFKSYNDDQIINFQFTLMKMQIGLQNIMTEIANIKAVNTPVILCDRGLLDGKAYMGKALWDTMLQKYKMNQQNMLKRYNSVIHMVTIADGNPQLFQKNKVRHETIEQAVKIDQIIKQSWSKHPNWYLISNDFVADFATKKTFLVTYIYQNVLPNVPQQKRLRKKVKLVNEGYYTYIQRKQKLKKRELMKIQRKNNDNQKLIEQ